jgi:hypothetical protein
MFTAQELRNQMAFALDAENSDHYRDDLDYIPAINAAMKWLTSVVGSAYGKDKIGEEFFRNLSYSGVFLTSNTSRVSLDVFPSEVWTILGIYVNVETGIKPGVPTPSTPDINRSYYLNNLFHISSADSCKRLSIEEWAFNKENPFESGYDGNQLCDALKAYSYLNPLNYQGDVFSYLTQEIEIRPAIKNKNLTIFWTKKPDEITSLTDNINFPNSVFQMLFDKALNYIAYKQGDQTNIYSVTNQDVQQLIGVL